MNNVFPLEHATHLQEKKTTQPQPSATPSEPKRSISTQDSKPPTETLPTSKPAASSSNHPAHPTPVTKPQEQPKPKPQEPSQPTSAPSNSAIPPASTVCMFLFFSYRNRYRLRMAKH